MWWNVGQPLKIVRGETLAGELSLEAGLLLARRYRLEAPIGAGAMGQVWRGVDLGLNRPIAIKILPPQVAQDENAVARFRREAESAAGLQHPGICAVFDIDTHGAVTFLVMELLQGSDLAGVLAAHPSGLPIDQVVGLAECWPSRPTGGRSAPPPYGTSCAGPGGPPFLPPARRRTCAGGPLPLTTSLATVPVSQGTRTDAVGVTVTSIVKGSTADLAGLALSRSEKGKTPYYAHFTLTNLGPDDPYMDFAPAQKMVGIDSAGNSVSSTLMSENPQAYPGQCRPAAIKDGGFRHGARYETCTVILSSGSRDITGVQWWEKPYDLGTDQGVSWKR